MIYLKLSNSGDAFSYNTNWVELVSCQVRKCIVDVGQTNKREKKNSKLKLNQEYVKGGKEERKDWNKLEFKNPEQAAEWWIFTWLCVIAGLMLWKWVIAFFF